MEKNEQYLNEREMNVEGNVTEIKLAINNFIWMNGRADMTLGEAEDKAVKILDIMLEVEKGKAGGK